MVVCSLLEILSCALAMWEARAVAMLRERACVAHSFGLWESGFAFAALAALGMRPVGAALNWVRSWRAWLGGRLEERPYENWRGGVLPKRKVWAVWPRPPRWSTVKGRRRIFASRIACAKSAHVIPALELWYCVQESL